MYVCVFLIIGLSRITRSIENQLSALGVALPVDHSAAADFFQIDLPACSPAHTLSVGIIDDSAFVLSSSPAEAQRLAATATSIIIKAYAAHGLTLNFAPSKTAAILIFAGPGPAHPPTWVRHFGQQHQRSASVTHCCYLQARRQHHRL